MKLISNFKNYYDHCVYSFGVDPLIVWKREPQKLSLVDYCKEKRPNLYLKAKELYGNRSGLENALFRELFPAVHAGNVAVIVVNDNVYHYPYIRVDTLNRVNIYPDGFCSFVEIFNKKFRKNKNPVDMAHILDSGLLNNDEWVEVRKFFKTPILVYGHQLIKSNQPHHYFGGDLSNTYFVESGLFSNPDISQYPLSKDMEPMDVYKNILAAFCCDMQTEAPPQQPEYTRIEAAGFDLKESFRRRKG